MKTLIAFACFALMGNTHYQMDGTVKAAVMVVNRTAKKCEFNAVTIDKQRFFFKTFENPDQSYTAKVCIGLQSGDAIDLTREHHRLLWIVPPPYGYGRDLPNEIYGR